jgi:hypothetical protein
MIEHPNEVWTESRPVFPIVELRRHRLLAGRREALIALFEQHLVEPQQRAGAAVLGSFRVAGEPDSFVWLRGFEHMRARQEALQEFYGGPAWKQHGASANAAVVDDEAHLLRAVAPTTGFPELSASPARDPRYLALLSDVRFPEGIGNYHNWLQQFLRTQHLDPLASFATLLATNNYPALPICQNRTVHLAVMRFAGHIPELPPELRHALRRPPEFLILEPTGRSPLR